MAATFTMFLFTQFAAPVAFLSHPNRKITSSVPWPWKVWTVPTLLSFSHFSVLGSFLYRADFVIRFFMPSFTEVKGVMINSLGISL